MRYLLITLLALFLPGPLLSATLANQLVNHASPYLAMHGQDPVQWQEWNATTVARAKSENKLLFVSSGYFSCHWCHVMQKESYQDKSIADILNKNYIPVKVDRELSAALDARLIDFVERTQGIAGWPLNVFITPDGHPLVGMVYVPPENFLQILKKLQAEWLSNRKELSQMAINAGKELEQSVRGYDADIPANLVKDYQSSIVHQAFTIADELQGGFGQENKFPSVPQLMTLLRVYQHTQDEHLYRFLRLSLDQMATQGLRDQLDGSFFRYAVDPGWQIPHFEKMLYDNALLTELYLQAARVLRDRKYKVIAEGSLKFMQQTMQLPSGGLRASLSAIDNLGIEGGYYVWGRDEVEKLLSKQEWQVAESLWGLKGAPDMDHGHHLVQASSTSQLARETGMPEAEISKHLTQAEEKLLKQRNKRQLPADNKVLAAWNGLALSAFVAAGKDKLIDVEQVRPIKNYIQKSLWDGKQLYRMKQSEEQYTEADLEDYAYVGRGVLAWVKWQDNERDWKFLETLVQQAWTKFYDDQGWKLSEHSLLKYRESQTLVPDGPMPSAAAVLIKTSLEIANLRKNINLQKQALMALSVGHDTLLENTFWHASYVDALYTHQQHSASK